MFQITPTAADELLRAARRSAADGLGLRIAARELDDGRLEIGMGFDEERDQDHRVDLEGLTVLLGAPSRALLDDAVLDFVEVAPGRHEFVFAPAEESAGCATRASGCGSGGCSACGA